MHKQFIKKSTILLVLITLILPSACTLPWMQEEDPLNITSKFKATWNVHEKIDYHADGTLSYKSVKWGGLVGLVKEHNLPVDWSGYESVTFEFAEPTPVETQILVAGILHWVKKGITKATCYFDGIDMRQVDQVVLQTAEPAMLTIKSVMLTPITTSWDSTPIWEGECVFGNWEDGFVVNPEKFSSAIEGDKLEFIFTTDYSDPKRSYWQIKTIYNASSETLEGNKSEQNEWGCTQVGRTATSYRIRLTAKDAKKLKKNGLFVNGYYVNVSQVNLLRKGVINGSGNKSSEDSQDREEKTELYNKWQ